MTLREVFADIVAVMLALPSKVSKDRADGVRALNVRVQSAAGGREPTITPTIREMSGLFGERGQSEWHRLISGDADLFAAKPGERSRICNMRWANRTVFLGETDFIHCKFFNCRLIQDGEFSMQNCYMEDCSIEPNPVSRFEFERAWLAEHKRELERL
jgi:hypothetical protein